MRPWLPAEAASGDAVVDVSQGADDGTRPLQPHPQPMHGTVGVDSLQNFPSSQANPTNAGLLRAAANYQPVSINNISSSNTSSASIVLPMVESPVPHRRKERISVDAVRNYLATKPELARPLPSEGAWIFPGPSPATICTSLQAQAPSGLAGWQTREPASADLQKQTGRR